MPSLRLGLALSMIDLETWTPRRLADVAAEAAWAEASGFDSAWISDHFFMDRDGRRAAGLEPMTVLAYLAARTSRIRLGAMVLCNNFRSVGQLAREVATLMEASDGRLVLGLGCGSSAVEHDAFDTPYDHRVGRLEESLLVLPRLLAGEVVTQQGRFVRLREASITTAGAAPPIWLAAFGPRMLGLTARLAQGWAGNWNGAGPERFRAEVADVRGALAAAGRAGAPFAVVANLHAPPPTGGAEALARRLASFREAGATDAVLAPSPRQFAWFPGADREELAAVAARIAAQHEEEAP